VKDELYHAPHYSFFHRKFVLIEGMGAANHSWPLTQGRTTCSSNLQPSIQNYATAHV